jgi:carbamoyl-phosphate synthase large subunit
MVIAYDAEAVAQYMKQAVEYSQERPVLVDHFLESASRSTSTRSATRKT